MTVFLGNINIRLKDSRRLFPAADAITNEFQKRRELRPGEKFSFNITPENIFEKVSLEEIVCAEISDDIDRIYESNQTDLQLLLKSIFEKKHK